MEPRIPKNTSKMTVLELITKLHQMPLKAEVYLDYLEEPEENGMIKLLCVDNIELGTGERGEEVVAIFPKIDTFNYLNN